MSSVAAPFSRSEEAVPGEYWKRATRPLASGAFLLPLLLIYEFGVYTFSRSNPEALRNGADYWMRGWLSSIGLSQLFLLPVLVLGSLLAWHVVSHQPWRVRSDTLLGMVAESLLFASVLIVIGQIHNTVFANIPELKELSVDAAASNPMPRVVAFIGAGVYEEVLFRLCLLPIAYGFFRMFEFPARGAATMAIVSTSLVFAFAHYVGPGADDFSLFSFSFRAIAGTFFATLFYLRGFGITVGAHATYDVLVGVLFASTV